MGRFSLAVFTLVIATAMVGMATLALTLWTRPCDTPAGPLDRAAQRLRSIPLVASTSSSALSSAAAAVFAQSSTLASVTASTELGSDLAVSSTSGIGACPKCECAASAASSAPSVVDPSQETLPSQQASAPGTGTSLPMPEPPPQQAPEATDSTATGTTTATQNPFGGVFRNRPVVAEVTPVHANQSRPVHGIWSVVFIIPAHPRQDTVATAVVPSVTQTVIQGIRYTRYPSMDMVGTVIGVHMDLLEGIAMQCAATPGCTGFTSSGALRIVTPWAQLMPAMVDLYVRSDVPMVMPTSMKADNEVDYLTETVQSFVSESQACRSPAFGGAYHAFVYNNAEVPATFAVYTSLADIYKDLPCITFVNEPPRIPVPDLPYSRPHLNLKREPPRVKQSWDLIQNIEHAVAQATHVPHIMVWEDDCTVCPGTFSIVEAQLQKLAVLDPGFGSLKIGNGGSGMLVNKLYVPQLLAFLKSIIHAENVDVSVFKYLEIYRHTDYITHLTWSAHHGRVSTFANYRWGVVMCGNELDYWWGTYKTCSDAAMSITWKCSSHDEYGVRVEAPKSVEPLPTMPAPN